MSSQAYIVISMNKSYKFQPQVVKIDLSNFLAFLNLDNTLSMGEIINISKKFQKVVQAEFNYWWLINQ